MTDSQKMPDPGRIVRLEIDNIKRLKAVRISPTGSLVVVSGRNDQGKSSVLDAIRFALGGPAAMKDTPEVVRKGAIAGRVVAEFETVTVTRTIVDGKQAVVLQPKEGGPFTSPQSKIDGMLTSLTFDPLKFAQLKPPEMRKMLIDLVDLGFDPDVVDEKIAVAYDQRTVIGREVTRLENTLKSAPEIAKDLPDEEVTSTDLFDEMAAITAHNARLAAAKASYIQLGGEVLRLAEEIHRLTQQLDDTAQKQAEYAEVLASSDPTDDTDVRARLENIDRTNAMIRNKKTVGRLMDDLARGQAIQTGFTTTIAELELMKSTALKNAAMPLPGLSFDDNGVTFDGIPLGQASESQRVKISAAIQMSLNPGIRVMLIDNGNSLDSENLQVLSDLAEVSGYQIWMTWVGDSDRSQVVIVDGEVSE